MTETLLPPAPPPAPRPPLHPPRDVAVVKLKNASNLPSARLDESGAVNIGDRVVGVGNALGRNGTPVSASGSVTTLDQTLEVRDEGDTLTETLNGMVCFDADIEPGDSGGPLFNQSGQVIGMDTAGTFVAA